MTGDKLFFSKSQYSAPHGMIDLSQCQTVKSAEFKAGIELVFIIIVPSRKFI